MLASIHPLGERARRQRFGVTATAYVAGSLAGGATIGALAGSVGGVLDAPPEVAALAAAAGTLAAIGADIVTGGRVPSLHRQVNERWLTAYRGWVYGLGFGFQLGLGVVTIVTTALVYATVLAALTTGSTAAGAAVGATFGLARAIPLAAVRSITEPSSLRAVHHRFQLLDASARRASLVAAAAAA